MILIDDFKKENDINDDRLSSLYSTFCVGDIESSLDDNNEWVFELIVISDGYKMHEFYYIDECIEWLFNLEYNVKLYFHNLDFDMLFFLKEKLFNDMIIDVNLINSGNLTIGFTVDNVTLLNSLTLLPMPLKNVVKKFLKVKDVEWLNDKSNVLDLDKETLLNYCRKDVFYLHSALLKYECYFKETWGIDLTLTVPSMAVKVWKKHFNSDDGFIGLDKRNIFFNDNYYFGGHTEKFVNDIKVFRNVNYYDVNSLYPFIMRDLMFINSKLIRTFPSIERLNKLVKEDELFFCEIDLNVDNEMLRFFPVLDEANKVNLYPFGVHRIKISEVGVKFILRYGELDNIVKVHNILIGEDDGVIKPFKSFVETFYKLRKSDKSNDVLFKLLLNSLYGKFGQKIERDVKILNPTKDLDYKSMVETFNDGMVGTVTEETKPYALNMNRLDIAGKVTEKARLYMGELINEINLEFGENSCIYTDTDSIITSADLTKSDNLKYLLHDDRLGALGDEIGYSDNVICLGQKMYHFYKSGKKATKGVKNMSLNDFRGVIRGENKFNNERFSRLNSLINRGFHGIQSVPYELKNIRERLDK